MNDAAVETALYHAAREAEPLGRPDFEPCELAPVVLGFLVALRKLSPWWVRLALGAVIGAVEEWRAAECSPPSPPPLI